jgi:hypothetical protein
MARVLITNTDTEVRWVGNALNTMGRDYLEKLSRQEIKVQNIAAAALAGLIVSGEAPLSLTIFDSNIYTAKKTGAPVEWRPLEPVVANIGSSGMTTRAPSPCGAPFFGLSPFQGRAEGRNERGFRLAPGGPRLVRAEI